MVCGGLKPEFYHAESYERLLVEEDRREQAAFLRTAKKNAKARLMADA